MIWLFGQLWWWLLLAFLVGAIGAFLVAKVALPHEDELESDTGAEAKGMLS